MGRNRFLLSGYTRHSGRLREISHFESGAQQNLSSSMSTDVGEELTAGPQSIWIEFSRWRKERKDTKL
jgi:hypothetical protein